MIFLDTNIFVYAADDADPVKHERAFAVLKHAVDNPAYMISAQVLNEFSNVALSKLKRRPDEVSEYVKLFSRITVVPVVQELTQAALSIKERYNLQFYDSLLLAAASANDCTEFWSEDLSDGQTYSGVKVVNPFR